MNSTYAFSLYFTVEIVDGVPTIKEEEEAFDTLNIVTALHWFDDCYEPQYDKHLLNVTESKAFKEIKEPGYYYFFQSGDVSPEISQDWESGLEDIDGWIFEEEYTVVKKLTLDGGE